MLRPWIALLRGVNVGGHGKLPMADARTTLSGLGYGHVRSHIQSGNFVFDAEGPADVIEAQITSAIAEVFGFAPLCIVLTPDQMTEALVGNPFPDALHDPKTLHLMFVKSDVSLDATGLRAHCSQDEEFVLKGGVFYFYTPLGFGRSKAAAKLDRFLKADVMTARNLGTCQKIAALAACDV